MTDVTMVQGHCWEKKPFYVYKKIVTNLEKALFYLIWKSKHSQTPMVMKWSDFLTQAKLNPERLGFAENGLLLKCYICTKQR